MKKESIFIRRVPLYADIIECSYVHRYPKINSSKNYKNIYLYFNVLKNIFYA